MDYQQAIRYFEATAKYVPVVTRDTMPALMEELGNPQDRLKYIHIAGTNGKGSTSAMLASILEKAGYRTGLYTSPFLRRFNDRIRVNGQEIGDGRFAELTGRLAAAADAVAARGIRRPTYFELVTALGFMYFDEERCDIVALEVGLGGRLDATNVIRAPECAVICTIGLDHTELLGDTPEKIAFEKAGIIKPGCDAVVYGQSPSVMAVFETACRERGARLHVSDNSSAVVSSRSLDGFDFSFGGNEHLRIGLLGEYQVRNACTAVTVCGVLRNRGWQISASAMRLGLAEARWAGRFELLRRSPAVIVDGAHNPEGVDALMHGLRALFGDRKLIFVMGMLADKDYRACVREALPLAKKIFAVAPSSSRALSSESLAEEIQRDGSGTDVTPCAGITEALGGALSAALKDDVVCIFGSLYQVDDVITYFEQNGGMK